MAEEPDALANRLLPFAFRQNGLPAIVLLDPEGIIVGWLAGAERAFGYKDEEIIGKEVSVLFTPEDLSRNLPN